MRHTLSVLVENRFGELARITGLFSARGYNIESLTVAETLDPLVSHITLVTVGDDRLIEQIVRQLNKQVRVLSVTDLSAAEHIEREMVLVSVSAGSAREEAVALAARFQAKVIDESADGITVEATGERDAVEALIGLLRPFGILNFARAGTLAIERLSAREGAAVVREVEPERGLG